MKRNILITGGTKGIGWAIAQKFHEQDFQVIICARGEAGLEQAQSKLPGIDTKKCDISQKEQVKGLGAYVNQKYGALDILINNGGVFLPGEVHNEDDETYEQLMATNMDSAYYLTKTVLPLMLEKKAGTIFNMCSVASLQAYPNGGSYSISKFALLGFSRALREEMKDKGIRVISVLPGAVYTPSWEAVDLPESRFIPAEDVAELIWSTYSASIRTVVEELLIRPALGDI
ncbi:MAG: SDR family oxidoreductase [Bacteroidota bacterium]